MSLFYCPACGQLYKAASAKYSSFCIRCGQPTPKKADAKQEALYRRQQAEIEKLHRWKYYSQAKTAKDVDRIFHPDKERPRRLAGGKSRGLDAVRMEKTPTDSLL